MHIVSRSSLHAQGSPLTYHRYGMTFLKMPPISLGDEKLSLRCISADKPSVQNEKTTLEQNGFRVHYSGKDIFPDNMSFTFVNVNDGLTIEALQDWKEFACNLRTGGSVSPDVYKGVMQLADLAYDNKTVIKTYTLYGVFPEDISFDSGYGTSVSPQIVNVTFSLDYWE